MKGKQVFCIILMLLLVVGSVFAAGGRQASGGAFDPAKTPVAIAIGVMNHPVHRIVQLGFLQAAQKLGYTNAKVIGSEGGDQSEVYVAAEAFAAEGGKGLLLWAGDSTAFEPLISLSRQGVVVGIPHFKLLTNTGTPPQGLAFNMACDPVLYGKQSAELMAEKLSGKRGSIAITQNTRNVTENSGSDSFIATWKSLASKYNLDGITLLPVELEGGVLDQATAINLAIIQAHPDIIGAFGLTGNSPLSWADAATKAGKRDGEIFIIGMDATEGNLNYLESGKVAAIVAQPLYEEAYKTMEYLDKIFRGEQVPAWTDLVAPIVTKDGTGPNGLAYHRDIAAQVATFFK
ncbi:MAG: sugar ABC transporter substrate-binding protein [Treponema sp.]|jgi:ribose transport system substrate-binding protein|nr:sugar ABC transporter substrate-binding protein [Treponema sp.]